MVIDDDDHGQSSTANQRTTTQVPEKSTFTSIGIRNSFNQLASYAGSRLSFVADGIACFVSGPGASTDVDGNASTTFIASAPVTGSHALLTNSVSTSHGLLGPAPTPTRPAPSERASAQVPDWQNVVLTHEQAHILSVNNNPSGFDFNSAQPLPWTVSAAPTAPCKPQVKLFLLLVWQSRLSRDSCGNLQGATTMLSAVTCHVDM